MAVLVTLIAVVGNTGSARPIDVISVPKEAPAALALPFDDYKFNQRELSTLERTYLLLVNECMLARGFDIAVPSHPSPQTSELGNSRRYGVADTVTARRFGYHFPADDGSRRTENWEAGLGQQEQAALYGENGQTACVDVAESELQKGTPHADRPWLTAQDFQSLEDSAKDARVVAAKHEWRECMTRFGQPYSEPEAAIYDPRWKLDEPAITVDERETAYADVLCKDASRLLSVWHTVESAAQQGVIARHPARFTALRENKDRRLANAHCVLARPEPMCEPA